MATTKSFAGQSFNLPLNREPKSSNWGTEVSNFLIALADYAIPKTGGSYTLSAELNLGATYGLLAPYLKSAGTNIATTGVVRLANAESIAWRNAANGANLPLTVNSSNWLQFNSVDLVDKSTAQTLTNKTLVAASNTITTNASGNLAATDLNAALAELQADIDTRQTSDSDLTAIAGLSSTGLVARTGSGTAAVRTVTAGTGIGVTNGDGVSGNPTIAIDSTVATLDGAQTLTNKTLTSPTLTTPALGTPASGTLTNATGLPIVAGTTGTLSVARGGTGQTTAQAAIDALVPSQTSNSGKVLGTDGTNVSWVAGLSTTLADGKIFVGNGSNVATAVTPTGDVTTTNAGVTAIGSSKVTNAMLAGSIADSKLSTISTAGKVSNSATTATNANTASAIVARDGSGNFSAGTITATGLILGNETLSTYDEASGSSTASVFSGAGSISSGTPTIDYYFRRVGKQVTFAVKLSGTYNLTANVNALGIAFPSGFAPSNTQTGALRISGSALYNVSAASTGILIAKFNSSLAVTDYSNNTDTGYISGSYVIE